MYFKFVGGVIFTIRIEVIITFRDTYSYTLNYRTKDVPSRHFVDLLFYYVWSDPSHSGTEFLPLL